MATEQDRIPGSDPDLDEDLFDFEEITGSLGFEDEGDDDLDEIFSAFETADETVEETSEEIAAVVPEEATPPGVEDHHGETVAPAIEEDAPAPSESAPAEPASSTDPKHSNAPPTKTRPASSGNLPIASAVAGMPRTFLWILVAMLSMNALIAIAMYSSNRGVRQEMEVISGTMGDSLQKMQSEYWEREQLIKEMAPQPTVLDPSEHPAFETALEEIGDGQYAQARQRLYALLAVIDRLEPAARQEAEARANYLIAHAWQLEAVQAMEVDQ